MKKMFFAFLLLFSIAGSANAQVDGKAIGLRFGYGGEISYQHPMGNANRLEFDLGYNSFGTNKAGNLSWGIALNGIYQWVWDLSQVTDGLNWYAGFGAAVLTHNNFLGVGGLGQVGIEYNFNIPFQLSLDYRPGVYLIPGTDKPYRPGLTDITLSARYRF